MATKTRAAKKTPAQIEQNKRAAADRQDAAIAAFRHRTRSTAAVADIPYTPETWTLAQLLCHRAADLDVAFKHASCLAGGWYRRAVTIDYQPDDHAASGEAYMLRPSEVAPLAGWMPCYEVRKVS